MHWILQENLFRENEWDTLVSTLTRFKIPFSIHKVVPFVGELIPEPDPKHPKVICFGSYSLRHTAKKYNWKPGVYDLFDINFLEQKKYWGENLLNYDSTVCEFKDAIIDRPTFIRPIDDSKYFSGKVFDPEEWNTWRSSICDDHVDYGNGLSPETLVQLCKPKTIYAEYRYWIVNGRIATQSLYKRGSRVIYSQDVDKAVTRYVHGIAMAPTLATRNPLSWLPKAFVIDVCETDEGFKIVEINTINSAGFYSADIQQLVMELEDLEN